MEKRGKRDKISFLITFTQMRLNLYSTTPVLCVKMIFNALLLLLLLYLCIWEGNDTYYKIRFAVEILCFLFGDYAKKKTYLTLWQMICVFGSFCLPSEQRRNTNKCGHYPNSCNHKGGTCWCSLFQILNCLRDAPVSIE